MSGSICSRYFIPIVAAMVISWIPLSAQATTPGSASVETATKSPENLEIDALKADVAQMRVILNQMATNLASVSDSQSPLKHQFRLDIDMWQILMAQMQRRINRLEGATSTPKPTR